MKMCLARKHILPVNMILSMNVAVPVLAHYDVIKTNFLKIGTYRCDTFSSSPAIATLEGKVSETLLFFFNASKFPKF